MLCLLKHSNNFNLSINTKTNLIITEFYLFYTGQGLVAMASLGTFLSRQDVETVINHLTSMVLRDADHSVRLFTLLLSRYFENYMNYKYCNKCLSFLQEREHKWNIIHQPNGQL